MSINTIGLFFLNQPILIQFFVIDGIYILEIMIPKHHSTNIKWHHVNYSFPLNLLHFLYPRDILFYLLHFLSILYAFPNTRTHNEIYFFLWCWQHSKSIYWSPQQSSLEVKITEIPSLRIPLDHFNSLLKLRHSANLFKSPIWHVSSHYNNWRRRSMVTRPLMRKPGLYPCSNAVICQVPHHKADDVSITYAVLNIECRNAKLVTSTSPMLHFDKALNIERCTTKLMTSTSPMPHSCKALNIERRTTKLMTSTSPMLSPAKPLTLNVAPWSWWCQHHLCHSSTKPLTLNVVPQSWWH